MTNTPLDIRTELSLSGWTDVTAKVYQRDGLSVTRGKPDESSTASPSSASLTVDNRTGNFSPRNPTGSYYGTIGRNTPLRLSLPDQSTYLRLEDDGSSNVTTPDSVALSITGDMELQLDIKPSNYDSQALAGKWDSGTENSWVLFLNPDGTLRLFWSTTGSNFPSATSTAPLPLGRVSVKVTLAVATGSVSFYTASSLSGPWTQLGSSVVTGATSIFDSTTALSVGNFTVPGNNGFQGRFYGFKLLSGIGGTVKAYADFTAATAGNATYTDAQGNVWTVNGTASFSNRKYRFHGEVPSWPQRWDTSGQDVYAPIQASGILRRLSQSGSVLNSAMYRGYVRLTGSAAPVVYWPCEDGSGATQLAEATGNGRPILFTGTPTLAANTAFACSGALPQIGPSSWFGTVPKYTNPASPSNVLRFLLQIPAGGGTDLTEVFRFYTNGSIALVTLTYGTVNGGSVRMQGFDSSGTQKFDSGYTDVSTAGTGMNGQLMRLSMELKTNGSSTDWGLVGMTAGATTGRATSGTVVSSSVGVVTRIAVNGSGGNLGTTTIGHISLQSTWDTLFDLSGPLAAWVGETAGSRFTRLLYEEGVAYRIYGYPANTRAMGTQQAKKLTDLLQECEDADGGMIYEPRESLSVGYRTRESLENQAAAITLSYTSGDLGSDSSTLIEPQDDDQRTRNDVTVTRQDGGSSSRQTLSSGTLSTAPPPNGVGTYAESVTVNLFLDSQLDDQAGWRLHVGTVDEPRYPVIPLNLTRLIGNSTKYYGIQDVDQGDFVDITSLPAWLPPGDLRQLVSGFTESFGGFVYTIAWNCIPEKPYETGVVGSGAATDNRVDTDGSTLSASATSGATSISVATTVSTDHWVALWTTTAGDFPFDIMVGGERMTVTNITGSSSPQTFTVTRSVNGVVKAHSSGEAVSVYDYAIVALDDPF